MTCSVSMPTAPPLQRCRILANEIEMFAVETDGLVNFGQPLAEQGRESAKHQEQFAQFW